MAIESRLSLELVPMHFRHVDGKGPRITQHIMPPESHCSCRHCGTTSFGLLCWLGHAIGYVVEVAYVVPSLINFTLYIPLDGVDARSDSSTKCIYARALRG